MKKKEVPWSELLEQSIPESVLKERSQAMKIAAWIMCAFLIIGGLLTPHKLVILFGVLYILVLVMDRSVAATPRGIEIFHDMKITTNYTIWEWKDIHAISREENAKYPNVYAVYFTKGDKSKRLFFPRNQWDAIVRLAKQGNHGLRVAKNS